MQNDRIKYCLLYRDGQKKTISVYSLDKLLPMAIEKGFDKPKGVPLFTDKAMCLDVFKRCFDPLNKGNDPVPEKTIDAPWLAIDDCGFHVQEYFIN